MTVSNLLLELQLLDKAELNNKVLLEGSSVETELVSFRVDGDTVKLKFERKTRPL